MKKLFSILSLLTLVLAMACGGKKHEHTESEHKEENETTWKSMDDFHFIMAESFHPYKDSANLAPAKKYAGEMAASAATWFETPRPEKVNNDEMAAKLEKLKTDTRLFAEAVKTSSDSTIGKSLTDLHHQFHSIQEAWYGGHEEHRD